MAISAERYLEAMQPYLSGNSESCSYCDRIEPLILARGNSCYVTLAIGQIVAGYTQVTTFAHRTAATGLLPHETGEFWGIVEAVRSTYEQVYGTRGVAFEHGEAANCLWGAEYERNSRSLCHHVHVHLVPVDVDIVPRISSLLGRPLPVESVSDLKRIRQEELQGAPYLYFQDANSGAWVFAVPDPQGIPRQLLRTAVAEEVGLAERADWRRYPGEELMPAGRAALEARLLTLVERSGE